MARTDNFTNFATDVADSIRSMTGKIDKIPAANFDTEIKSIETKEDLTEELNTYETEITEQELSIDTIIEALEGKAAGSGNNSTKPLYLIANGYDVTDNTGGYTFKQTVGNVTNATGIKQGTESLNLYTGLWADCNITFNNDFDVSKYSYLCVDFAYPTTNVMTSMQQYIGIYVHFVTSNTRVALIEGSTTDRVTIKLPLEDVTSPQQIKISCANLSGSNGQNESAYTEAHPLMIYNVWLEGELSLQDKSVEITENGTTNIVADEGYYGLNSVDVTVNVEGGETTIIDAKVYSTEEQLVGKWIDNKPLYRKTYNATITNAVTAGSWGEVTTVHNITNVETIFIGEGSFIKDSAGTVYEVNCATHISNTSVRVLKTIVNSVNIYTFWSADMLSAGDIVAQYTLYYTKTTDVATDETLGTVNYSTEEQVVGTNIDGLTLYQKTVVGDGLSYSPNGGNTTTTIAHNIDNVKDIYIDNGSFMYSNYYSGTSRNIYQPNMFNTGDTPGRQYITTRVNKTNITQIVGDWIIGGYNSICTRITLRYTKTV